MIRNGTGSAKSQPTTRIGLRPMRSDARAAIRLMTAFVTPKLTMNDVMAVFDLCPTFCSPSCGAPRRRRHGPLQPDHRADEGVQENGDHELGEVLPQPEPHLAHSPLRLR